MLYDFDDILIEPARVSDIKSRKEVNPKHSNGFFPIMSAPMDTVIDEMNYSLYQSLGIYAVTPRIPNPSENYVSTSRMLSYSLEDFERVFIQNAPNYFTGNDTKIKVLIDVANGHMKRLMRLSEAAKDKYGNTMFLMVGNVANPETLYDYGRIGVDAVRIGIGNGNGCLTTVQTGVGYPMASLIQECRQIKIENDFNTLIVADGGFKKYADIIKAIALGADYVMLGSIFNKALESSGETMKNLGNLNNEGFENYEVIDQFSEEAKQMFHAQIPLYKTFRGMSTKEVQKAWGKEDLTTSEGIIKKQKVEYTLEGWVKNFESYLRSAMSYTGKKFLSDFIGGVNLNKISNNSFRRFDK